jgi:hypothetical protein
MRLAMLKKQDSPVTVRSAVVMAWLRALHALHPAYRDITVDDSLESIARLDHFTEELLQHRTYHIVDEDVLKGEHYALRQASDVAGVRTIPVETTSEHEPASATSAGQALLCFAFGVKHIHRSARQC